MQKQVCIFSLLAGLYNHNRCFFFYVSECYTGNGEMYKGRQMKTRSGIPCASWNDHTER